MRRLWADYPLRKVWKNSQLRPVTPEERIKKVFHPSTKKVGQCVYCRQWMAGSKLECDHVVESDGCTSKETAESFLWHCAGDTGDNFVTACRPCHKIKSYAERQGISYEEAVIVKKAIDIQKKDDKVWITEQGEVPASNAKLRREQIIDILRKGACTTNKK